MALKEAWTLLTAAALAASANCAVAGQSSMSLPGPVVLIAQQTYVDVVGMLERSGYRVVDMKSTFLGRIRIRAKNREHLREVVVSRSTGEIKSDQIIRVFAVAGEGETREQIVRGTRSGTHSAQASTNSGVSASVGDSSGSVNNSGVGASVGGASVSVGGGGVSIGN